MKRIAIIGGGISGLSAAFTLEQRRRAGVPLQYVLYESSSCLGGVISTEYVDGCVVEAGPDSFLTEKPWAADLCRELGLGDQLIGSNDAERKTYILLKGRLVPIPDGLMFMVPTARAKMKALPSLSNGIMAPSSSNASQTRCSQAFMAATLLSSVCVRFCRVLHRWKPVTAAWDAPCSPGARKLFTHRVARHARYSRHSRTECSR